MKGKTFSKIFCKIGVLAAALAVSASCIFGGINIDRGYAAAENDITIEAKENKIIITGSVPSGKMYLVRFKPNYYHSSTEFLQHEDDTNTSLKYYDKNAGGFIECEVSSVFKVEIDRYTPKNEDKAYDKFYVIEGGSVSQGKLYGGKVIVGPKYATEFFSKWNYAKEEKTSNKGLEVLMVDDGEDLGIQHTNHVYDINKIISAASDPTAIKFQHNGKTYYFNSDVVKSNDKILKALTDAGMEVTGVLNTWAYEGIVDKTDLLHPEFDFDPRVDSVLCMAAPNMVEDKGVEMYEAVAEFLAERYLREDAKYGRISNWIIGNEIDTSVVWHNMGQVPIEEFVRQYDRSMRIVYTAVKKYWKYANVMPVLTQVWNITFSDLFGTNSDVYKKWHNKGSFTSKDVLWELNALTKKEGDYDWKVAFHPYGIDMRENQFWDRQNVEWTNKGPDSNYLTPLNIEELPRFLSKQEMKYNGKMRDFYFTEQGFSSKPNISSWNNYNWQTDYDPETSFTEQSLMEQCAMYAFAYYKFKFIGAKANIHHRQFDYYTEQAALGIWFREKGTVRDIYAKKPVWEVMKYIDTERSLEFTLPLLKYIRIWSPSGTYIPTSWEELIPGDVNIEGYEKFDASKLADAPLVKSAKLSESDAVSDYMVTDFENNQLNGWEIADNASSFTAIKSDKTALNGSYLGVMRYSNDKTIGGGYAHKGIQKIFENPVDMSNLQSFNFAVNVTNATGANNAKQFIKVRFYSKNNVYESVAEIKNGKYYKFSVPLKDSGWSGVKSVVKIKIWYNKDSNDTVSSAVYFDDIGFTQGGGKNENGQGCGCKSAVSSSGALMGILLLGAAFVVPAVKSKKDK